MSDDLRLTLAPPPAGATGFLPDAVRGHMVTRIHDETWAAMIDTPEAEALFLAVWDRCDGYGNPGTVPPQGYDWSGIRDSSDVAVCNMYEVLVIAGRA